jgi:REP element-mobilizing transposase RayT
MPGLLQHVIVRGIERRDIFLDDEDRHHFVQRFSELLEKTGTECFAWALMSNHLHLLVCPRNVTLATFMRRLLTGYAVTFNLRHIRSGHLFQNRYKSIVCDHDEYLLELVRYIHLNPVRAGVVADVVRLERYPWCGHSVVLGKGKLQGQDVESVLSLFGKKMGDARRRYRLFVQDGVSQGGRDDLVGRRCVSQQAGAEGSFDARILGDSDFIERLRLEDPLRERIEVKAPLQQIVEKTAKQFAIPARALSSASRLAVVVKARAIACHLALSAGHSAAGVGRHLGMSRYGVAAAANRGRVLVDEGGNDDDCSLPT